MAARRRRVEWTARARTALDDAVAYIASDSPAAAEQLLVKILDAAASLTELTERGRVVPELEEPFVRELVIPPYGWFTSMPHRTSEYSRYYTQRKSFISADATFETDNLERLAASRRVEAVGGPGYHAAPERWAARI